MNQSKRDGEEGFAEPWQAEALALASALKETGHISPVEWSAALGQEMERARAAGHNGDGTAYYEHILAALERLLEQKGLLSAEALHQRRLDWERSYHDTPHGQPVVLKTNQ